MKTKNKKAPENTINTDDKKKNMYQSRAYESKPLEAYYY